MNVFELSAVASPLIGAIAGGVSVKASGAIPVMIGIGMGLALGLAVYFAAMGFAVLMFRVQGVRTKTEKLNPIEWLASLAAVLVPMASPFAAWALSVFVVARVLHL